MTVEVANITPQFFKNSFPMVMNHSNNNYHKHNKWFALTAGLAIACAGTFAPTAKAATYSLDFDQGANGGNVLYNANGTLQTDQWASWGLTNISGLNSYTNNAAKFNLYNSSVYSGNNSVDRDWDLTTGTFVRNGNTIDTGTELQGNVLIIQEESNSHSFRNGVYVADDEARGGYVDFDFASAVAFNSFSMLDIDDNGGGIRVEGRRADGSLLSIDIDALMSQHLSMNGSNAAAAQGTSVSLNGVTMTQVGNRRGDNSMFRFDVDQAHLTSVRFSYPGSGAISGLEWDTIDAVPEEIPEPSVLGGLLMLGLISKGIKRKRDLAANA